MTEVDELPPRGGALKVAVGMVLTVGLLLLVLFLIGWLPRRQVQAELAASAIASQNALPEVSVQYTRAGGSVAHYQLPGTVRAEQDTGVYARVDGYLKSLLADVGDHVKEGQILAEIDAPEIDQRLNESQAQLVQAQAQKVLAEANLKLAKDNLARVTAGGTQGAFSPEEIDDRTNQVAVQTANVRVADANIVAAQAAVASLQQQQSFEKVTAPFDGVITARRPDIGTLISQGSNAGNNSLFSIARSNVVRVFVDTPQPIAPFIHGGADVAVSMPERPTVVYHGAVFRTADALSESTRTMLTEVHVANEAGGLLPGMYVTAEFTVDRPTPPVIVPAAAIQVRSTGTYVIVIGDDDRVSYQQISILRDLGTQLEVSPTAKLVGHERVVVNLGQPLAEGAQVKPIVLSAASEPGSVLSGPPVTRPG